LIRQIRELAKEEMVTRYLVGLPVNADGTEGEQASEAREFAMSLACAVPEPVFLWDEYGSSQAAQERLLEGSHRRKARRERLDAVAAAVFLQEYVDRDGAGAERVYPEGEMTDG
jgi:putative Holliday junction resolvase